MVSGTPKEVWVIADDRDDDADLAILRCAADLAALHPSTGARVLTGDFGMQLRAQHMNLSVLSLPGAYRKVEAPVTPTGRQFASPQAAPDEPSTTL